MITVGMILFPRLTELDLTGSYEVFARMPDTRIVLAAASLDPVISEHGLTILPGRHFRDHPCLRCALLAGGQWSQ